MAILKILKIPHPLLRNKSLSVSFVDGEIRSLMNDMLETVYAAPGIGLAAPQVGVLKRIIVIDLQIYEDEEKTVLLPPLRMVNPKIIESSSERQVYEEGCLSVPGQNWEIERPSWVKVSYIDSHNQEQILEAHDLLSICVQHEIDHLDGILFPDYLSPIRRQLIFRKAQKEARKQFRE